MFDSSAFEQGAFDPGAFEEGSTAHIETSSLSFVASFAPDGVTTPWRPTLATASTNMLTVTAVRRDTDHAWIEDAIITLDILQLDETPILTGIVVPHVAGTSNAAVRYRGVLPVGTSLPTGSYLAVVRVEDIQGNVHTKRIKFTGAFDTVRCP